VQTCGNEGARDAGGHKRGEIGRIAYSSGGVDKLFGSSAPDRRKPVRVGTHGAPDARQRHRNDAAWPNLRITQQNGRPDEGVAAVVERQNDPIVRGEAADEAVVMLRLAAQDKISETGIEPTSGVRQVGHAIVNPECEIRKFRPQLPEGRVIVSLALDGIEIRYVECRERVDGQETAGDIDRMARRRQRRFDVMVLAALSHARMDDSAVLKIDDGYNLHYAQTLHGAKGSGHPILCRDSARGDMSVVIGWDIGGVHLKAARAEDGRITKAAQYASPLRAGTEHLLQAFGQARTDIGRADSNIVTMTGELADTFSSRAEGVARLAMLAAQQLEAVSIYAGPAGCVRPQDAPLHSVEIASANWHACAALIARKRRNALFIDLGSTTTDIIPIIDGKVAARGYTDWRRLATGELVYTGLVRGFVMATASRAPLRGAWTPLINENFATMADVHRILGTLPPGADLMATADGREKTVAASRARLARMLGADASDADDNTWTLVARWFAESQLRTIADAAMLVLSSGTFSANMPIIAAGIGVSVIAEIARRFGCSYTTFDELFNVAPDLRAAVCHCAPAAALACLSS
jgi:(4-(4-[2-(gamma-L-glutamylamino)ethyl]phenoxymethyl)furan-2-yl)methanamine synthase